MKTDHLKTYREALKTGAIAPPDRLTPIEKANRNPKSLRLAINGKCYDCTCGQRLEIKHCVMDDCTLYPLRPYQDK